jgi:hypothetical protein
MVIEEPRTIAHPLRIANGNPRLVGSRFLVVPVGSNNAAAFKLKVGGTTTPEMPETALMYYGWMPRLPRSKDQIRISGSPTERNTIEEIADYIVENVLEKERDTVPGIRTLVLVGISVQDSPFLRIGHAVVEMPYEGKISVTAYNETYGILASEWFKIKVTSWDNIEFPKEPLVSFPPSAK